MWYTMIQLSGLAGALVRCDFHHQPLLHTRLELTWKWNVVPWKTHSSANKWYFHVY